MPSFKSIFLVDDDDASNFFHKLVIDEWGKVEKTYVKTNGKSALEFLKSHHCFQKEFPSLILLDINMPVMDGFEFLEEYNKLDEKLKATFLVVMLTTSLHKEDRARARQFQDLKGFINKPLSLEQLEELAGQLPMS